jgi:hypothetical protein
MDLGFFATFGSPVLVPQRCCRSANKVIQPEIFLIADYLRRRKS